MIRKLHTPTLPENERKRIAQIAVDRTKREAYKECLVTGECEGPIVGGHLIPRAWLKRVCDDNEQVQVFAALPISVFRADRRPNSLPVLNHINNAFVGSFTCRRHEEIFGPIDDPFLDLTNQGNLNFMLYKSILASLWSKKLLLKMAQACLAEVPQDERFTNETVLQQQRISGLEYYKQRVEGCLNPQSCRRCEGGRCKVIDHKMFYIPGEPALAVSEFSGGIRKRVSPGGNFGERITNWGMTVLPLSEGHKVIFHHFTEEEGIIEPLGQVLSHLQGKKLQGQISYWILKSFENLAVSPRRWEQFGKRSHAMLDVFLKELPDVGFGSMGQMQKWEENRSKRALFVHNYNQLNLFSPDKR